MNNILSQTAQRRLRAEHLKIKTDGMECGFYACPRASHYNIWDVFIRGSENSLYEGTVMHAQLIFPPEYPIYPPQMYFLQKMFHPNVYPDGKVCISILHVAEDDPTSYEKADEKWTPVQGIRTIILSVISLLNEPNCNSPANVDASKLFNENIVEYNEKVRKKAIETGKNGDFVLDFCKIDKPEEREDVLKCLYEKKEMIINKQIYKKNNILKKFFSRIFSYN
ncbi:ubiquitin conjugating enzyme Ubc7/UbcP3 [Gurleya vavrai]